MTPPPPPRTAGRVIDIVAGALLALLGLLIGMILLASVAQYSGFGEQCVQIGCDAGPLGVMQIAATAVIVFGWAVTFGLFLVRVIRRRLAFFLPLIGIAVMIAAFWALTAGVGAWLDAASS